jgi:hypothetical protein
MERGVAQTLSEMARVVREHARWSVESNTSTSITFDGLSLVKGEVVECVECGVFPTCRQPCGELVRVNFDTPRDVAAPRDLVLALAAEVVPVVIGVGKVRAEQTPEGFVVFLLDDREVLGGHKDGSDIETTPEMIEAGADMILAKVGGADLGPFSADVLADQVYRAMDIVRASQLRSRQTGQRWRADQPIAQSI